MALFGNKPQNISGSTKKKGKKRKGSSGRSHPKNWTSQGLSRGNPILLKVREPRRRTDESLRGGQPGFTKTAPGLPADGFPVKFYSERRPPGILGARHFRLGKKERHVPTTARKHLKAQGSSRDSARRSITGPVEPERSPRPLSRGRPSREKGPAKKKPGGSEKMGVIMGDGPNNCPVLPSIKGGRG